MNAPAFEPRTLALLGNEALGRGLVEAGCHLVMAYPGTPSSEVLPAVVRFAAEEGVRIHTEWCANEKVALEQALAASYTGKRTAVIMKQVGLNVAADPLMSAAYIGVLGGLVIVVADDPGPASSQTEQDTRQMAHFAKLPVLDPSSPSQAREMAAYALDLSERHGTPVILRIALRICHGRQDIALAPPRVIDRPADFKKDPLRWAATPRQRYRQHVALNARLQTIAAELEACPFNRLINPDARADLAVIAAGHPLAVLLDCLQAYGLERALPILELGAPHPFPRALVQGFVARHRRVLVLEETDQLIELLLDDRGRVLGRGDGTVPDAGELDAATIGRLLGPLLVEHGLIEAPLALGEEGARLSESLELPSRPPTLCAGCPHRASFLAILGAGGRRGVYPSDIGCYTLGVNMGGVDTCHDMGAAVSMAAGFYQAYHHDGRSGEHLPPIIATIGDSTFYHGGLSPLASAVYSGARFTLVILDNRITAMTGMQPPLASGVLADGTSGNTLSIADTCRGLGVRFVEAIDPYQVPAMQALLRRALDHNRAPDGGVSVVIAERPCVLHEPETIDAASVAIDDPRCNACGLCLDRFGCPALAQGSTVVELDRALCVDCGVCVHACFRGAIVGQAETER